MTTFTQYPVFYRDNGIKRATMLLDPEPSSIKNLPSRSMLHVLGNEENPLVDPSEPLAIGYADRVRLAVVRSYPPTVGVIPAHTVIVNNKKVNIPAKEVTQVFGQFRTTSTAWDAETMKFCAKNTRFQLVKEYDKVMLQQNQLMIFNYGYLDKLHVYQNTVAATVEKTWNKFSSFVHEVQNANRKQSYNHFLLMEAPQDLVSKSTLDTRAMMKPQQLGVFFDTPEKLFIRELWLWINPDTTEQSVLARLSDDDIATVNLVYRVYDGRLVTLNLGWLKSWVKGNKNLTGISAQDMAPLDLQKYVLKMLITLQSINATGIADAAAAAEKAALPEGEGGPDSGGRFLGEETSPTPDTGTSHPPESEGMGDPSHDESSVSHIRKPDDKSGKVVDESDKAQVLIDQQLKDLDADLEALDQIEERRLKRRAKLLTPGAKATGSAAISGSDEFAPAEAPEEVYSSEIPETVESIRSAVFTPVSVEASLQAKLVAAADERRLSAADYRKLNEMVRVSPLQPDPYGSGKNLKQAMTMTPEDRVISVEDSTLVVPPLVLDKSMHTSTLNAFDSRYNVKTLPKDILRMTQHLQRSGVIIKKHTVDTSHSVMGSFEVHSIELKPIKGQPSIIRHRVPIVDDEGSFRAAGVKYSMRKQIAMIPIAKVSPQRVALSSYYGKVFIDRASKKADSYIETVTRRLNKATIEPDDRVFNVAPGDVFDSYFEAPYVYSALAKNFQSFQAGQYSFVLSHKEREKAASPEFLQRLEKNGRRLIGQGPGKQPLVIDQENQFFLVGDTQETPVGDIFDILTLERTAAPVDFTEVTVFSKSIPVGIFLAYQMAMASDFGFRRLVKFLGARHRLVEGRQQKKLTPYEYAVSFKDVSYIFDRRDSTASLLLAGFRAFEKEIKQYDAVEFDSPDVYLRLLEAKGLSAIYLNEMKHMVDMFIDPITHDVLEAMGQPTTFTGLLISGTKMLTTYTHPASQDMNFQRIRGYERFAGAIYKEMCTAIRSFDNRNRTGRAKVEMSPYQVWQKILKDRSVKQTEDINPIQSLKAVEALTYVGEGGRAKEAMNKDSRAYHKSNIGIVSTDGNIDSGDVGINSFMAPDPQIGNLQGIPLSKRKTGPATLQSTACLLSAFTDHDD